MKKRIYEIIEVSKEDDKASHVYDLVMMFIIFISIIWSELNKLDQQLRRFTFIMRYTKEFKLECVRKYMNGEHIPDPGGCTHRTFYRNVLRWVKIFNQLGEIGLEHKKPPRIICT